MYNIPGIRIRLFCKSDTVSGTDIAIIKINEIIGIGVCVIFSQNEHTPPMDYFAQHCLKVNIMSK